MATLDRDANVAQFRAPPTYTEPEKSSITDLLRELRDETTTLFRQEALLMRTEVSEKAARVGRNTGYLAAGGLVAYAGLLMVLVAAAIGLTLGLRAMGLEESAYWLSPLIIGLAAGAVGYALVTKALATLRNESAMPEKTMESLKEDTQWAKSKVS